MDNEVRKYGDIPDTVLTIEMKSWDDDYVTIQQLIDEATNETILQSKYALEYNDNNELTLRSLTFWTATSVYMLVYAWSGYAIIGETRNPSEVDPQ